MYSVCAPQKLWPSWALLNALALQQHTSDTEQMNGVHMGVCTISTRALRHQKGTMLQGGHHNPRPRVRQSVPHFTLGLYMLCSSSHSLGIGL
jgi:hypothetical protein